MTCLKHEFTPQHNGYNHQASIVCHHHYLVATIDISLVYSKKRYIGDRVLYKLSIQITNDYDYGTIVPSGLSTLDWDCTFVLTTSCANCPFLLSILQASCPSNKDVFKHIQAYLRNLQRIFRKYD
jgi:hypothetical protein